MPLKRISVSPSDEPKAIPTSYVIEDSIKKAPTFADTVIGDNGFDISTISGAQVAMPMSRVKETARYSDRVSWLGVLSKSASSSIGVAGLKYAVTARENSGRRWIWAVILTAAMLIAAVQIIQQVHYFATYPKSVDVVVENVDELPFPTVAVCNFNKYRQSKISGTPFEDLMTAAVDDPYTVGDYTRFNEALNNTGMDEIVSDMGHQKTAFFYGRFQGDLVDASNYTMKITDFGLCTMFNTEDVFREPLMAKGAGLSFGLTVMLNVEQYDYFFDEMNRGTAGFQVYLFEKGTEPMVMDLGFAISPGSNVMVGVELHETHSLPPPYGSCSDKPLKYYDRYGLAECQTECMTDIIVTVCGCKRAYMPGPARVCNPVEYVTCAKGLHYYASSHATCSCPQPCATVTYKPTISAASYPSIFWQNHLNKVYLSQFENNFPDDHFQNNMCYLNIYFREMSIHRVSEYQAYTFTSLLCDIGGSLGLWLGGSILTIVELCDLFGHATCVYAKMSGKLARSPKNLAGKQHVVAM
ncbi:acid-sensing ion channel 2-like [Diadema setosum]|uniref:acid-sensing ion channel 2-like n=1 Tax=Diadema setosum TaxID=31175 RepID=UPI003B3B52E4